jgi:hypothetical protein
MKTKHYYLSGLLLVVLISVVTVSSSLQAQTSLIIQGTNNSLADYPLQNIKKVFFPTSSILQVDNGSAVQVQLSSIKKMYFANSPTTVNPVLSNIIKTRLYPVPVQDQFTVEVEASNTEASYLEIIDLVGHTVSNQKVIMNTGKNSIIINSEALRSGFYFCKISSGNSTEIIKFNKK